MASILFSTCIQWKNENDDKQKTENYPFMNKADGDDSDFFLFDTDLFDTVFGA